MSWWFIETLDWRTWKVQSYTLIRHGFIHKLLPIPYSFSSYDITISSTFQCITGETNGGRQRNVLNREREYGTMRYRRGMVTGRDFKERGCREDSCIILFALLFVPLSKLARANAIWKKKTWRIRSRNCKVRYRLYRDRPFGSEYLRQTPEMFQYQCNFFQFFFSRSVFVISIRGRKRMEHTSINR